MACISNKYNHNFLYCDSFFVNIHAYSGSIVHSETPDWIYTVVALDGLSKISVEKVGKIKKEIFCY